MKKARWWITNYFIYKSRDMVTRFIHDGYISKHSIMDTLCHVLDNYNESNVYSEIGFTLCIRI